MKTKRKTTAPGLVDGQFDFIGNKCKHSLDNNQSVVCPEREGLASYWKYQVFNPSVC